MPLGVVMGVVSGVDALRWGFSGSHMRYSMNPRRSAGFLMRATPSRNASSATAVATCNGPHSVLDIIYCILRRVRGTWAGDRCMLPGQVAGALVQYCQTSDWRLDLSAGTTEYRAL